MKKILWILLLCMPQFALAELPNTVKDALKKIGLSEDRVSVYVQALLRIMIGWHLIQPAQ